MRSTETQRDVQRKVRVYSCQPAEGNAGWQSSALRATSPKQQQLKPEVVELSTSLLNSRDHNACQDCGLMFFIQFF